MSVLELITANGSKTTENKLRLLSINEVRKILGIRYDTVKRLIESGEIEIILRGKKLIIQTNFDNSTRLLTNTAEDIKHHNSEKENNKEKTSKTKTLSAVNSSEKNYDKLALLSKREARKILKIGNDALNKLINNGDIEVIPINDREKIAYISIYDFVNRMSARKEPDSAVTRYFDEKESVANACKIIREIKKGVN